MAAPTQSTAPKKGCFASPSMLEMVDFTVSFKVVNCFIGICIFQVTAEYGLEYLENLAQGTVYATGQSENFTLLLFV